MEWQPIETAPKDGTNILAWNYNPNYLVNPYIAWFGVDLNEADDRKKEWLTGDGDDFSTGHYFTPCQPTHWMPLPEPPKQEKK